MSVEFEKQEANRLMTGIEDGGMTAADAYNIAENRDPVFLYFMTRYLREKYPPGSPQAQGVTERLIELTSTYDSIVKAIQEGEKDSMREWFDDSYSMKEFFRDSQEFVDLIVDKLES